MRSDGSALRRIDVRRIDAVLGALDLQGNYSERLYGAPGRVDLRTLKLVWLPLLSQRGLAAIANVGGICLLHAKYPFP